ncbi:TetR/AcrR family transcriptional regulator [Labedella endophytica]|uniref:TetR/AcrR family transcriptional regulator n=1 Tax=Labedella endophytica TaxID=1523160 RepID=UPI00140A406B|nr:TetR/AcrR family transcriptional regulator [Labedella endophytica]
MSRSERAYHHGDLAAALEAAAFELVDEAGHSSLSLREVARRADVSHNAPYHHYGDRASLLARLGALSMGGLLDRLEAAQRRTADRPPTERASAIAAAYIGFAADNHARFRLMNDPEICDPRHPSASMAPLLERVHGMLAELVDDLDPQAEPAGRAALRTAIWGAVHGLAELVVTGQIDRAEVAPALDALLGGHAPRPADPSTPPPSTA